MLTELAKKYAELKSKDFTLGQIEELKDGLRNVKTQEVNSIETANLFLTLLKKLRTYLAVSLEMNGDNFSELLTSILSVGNDGIYSNHLRFIFELIQNVDDCKYSDPDNCQLEMHFDFNANTITLKYNEIGFSPFNVFAITGIGEKAKNTSTFKREIGEKGIGFKSVFGVAERVWIRSGWFSFELHKNEFTIPKVHSVEEYCYGTCMILYVSKDVKQIYQEVKGQYCRKEAIFSRNPLLFLNNLTCLRMYYDEWRSMEFSVSKRPCGKSNGILKEDNILISVELHDHDSKSNINIERTDIVCTRYTESVIYSREACQSRYGSDTKVGSDGNKEMLIQVLFPSPEFIDEVGNGSLYSFLPTQLKLTVPIVCHVPFKLDASREFVDPQDNNLWFCESTEHLSRLIDAAYLDYRKTVHQNIIKYLPGIRDSLFDKNNGKEKCLREIDVFGGNHFLQLPLLYTTNGKFESADNVCCFKHEENIIEPEKVHRLLDIHESLFIMPMVPNQSKYGIRIITAAYKQLVRKSLLNQDKTADALALLDCAKYYYEEDEISAISSLNITIQQIETIFKYKRLSRVFINLSNERIKKHARPSFSLQDDTQQTLTGLLSEEFDVNDMPERIRAYLSFCSQKCILADIGDTDYLPCKNALILSKKNIISSLATFCSEIDHHDTFSIRMKLKEASNRLNHITQSEIGTADDYIRALGNIRQLVIDSIGRKGYNSYVNLIQRAGTDKNRYVQELLQNADDCHYPNGEIPTFVLFQKGNSIVTKYNEDGFSRENIRAITAIGESTKNSILSNDVRTIGEKGVGFKSVFSIASKVRIDSGQFHFELNSDSPTIPRIVKTNKDELQGTRMEILLKERESFSVRDNKTLLKLCLCLRNLKRLEINSKVVLINDDESYRYISIDNRKYVFRRYIHSFEVDNEIVDKIEKIEHKKLSLQQSIVCYVPEKKEGVDFCVYNGLPTKHRLNIPMSIDAPFELTTSREEIETDKEEWNNHIRKEFYRAIINVMLQLRDKEGIKILRFIKYKMELHGRLQVYVNDISDSGFLKEFSFTDLLRKEAILPTYQEKYYAIPSLGKSFRYPPIAKLLFSHNDFGAIERSSIIKDDDADYESIFKALLCQEASATNVFSLVEQYAEIFLNEHEYRDLLYSYLSDVAEQFRDRILNLEIIPVYSTTNGKTKFLNYYDVDGKLYVKKGVSVSTETYFILNERYMSKSICESIFCININEMNIEYERVRYQDKLREIIRGNNLVEIFHYLLAEYNNGNLKRYHGDEILKANRDSIPLKSENGTLRTGNVFICDIPEYYNGPLLRSHIASKDCKEFAKMLQCNSISEIGPNNLEIVNLTAEDIEDLYDEEIVYGNTIMQHFLDLGRISPELIQEYDLVGFKKTSYSDYTEDDFPDEPIRNYSSLQDYVSKQCANPREIIKVTVPRQIDKVVIPGEGEQLVDSGNIRSYTMDRYTVADNTNACFCQMCLSVKDRDYIEVNNIVKNPKYYWPQLRISLCLECSKKFEFLRSSDIYQKRFIDAIKSAELFSVRSLRIPIGSESIQFTQTHLAEIQEILKSGKY